MNRTKVILSIFLMLFLLLAGLVLPSFWKSQKKEASGNKGREPAKETTETNSDTPMPEYLDFDALKAFFSDRIRFRLPTTPQRVCFYLEKTGYRSLQIRLFTKSKPMIPCRP